MVSNDPYDVSKYIRIAKEYVGINFKSLKSLIEKRLCSTEERKIIKKKIEIKLRGIFKHETG